MDTRRDGCPFPVDPRDVPEGLRDAGWVQVSSWEPGWRQVNGLTKELSGGFEAIVIPA